MIKLKNVGFFKDLKHGESVGPAFKADLSNVSQKEAEITNYLAKGTIFLFVPGMVFDNFSIERKIIGSGPHVLTDGEWAWPSDLSYYYKNYHCTLPAEFIEHLSKKNFKVPTLVDKSTLVFEHDRMDLTPFRRQ